MTLQSWVHCLLDVNHINKKLLLLIEHLLFYHSYSIDAPIVSHYLLMMCLVKFLL